MAEKVLISCIQFETVDPTKIKFIANQLQRIGIERFTAYEEVEPMDPM